MLIIQLKKHIKYNRQLSSGWRTWCWRCGSLPGYIMGDANVAMGALLIPYICTVDRNRYSLRYLMPALLFAVPGTAAARKHPVFCSDAVCGLLLIENSVGRVSDILLFLLLLISPVFGLFYPYGRVPGAALAER
jgi:hypothetical protein